MVFQFCRYFSFETRTGPAPDARFPSDFCASLSGVAAWLESSDRLAWDWLAWDWLAWDWLA
jgi:hypothetical protein